jgi:hypothetical protein
LKRVRYILLTILLILVGSAIGIVNSPAFQLSMIRQTIEPVLAKSGTRLSFFWYQP